MADSNGSQSERNRPYVVLEQTPLGALVVSLLSEADISLDTDQAAQLEDATAGRQVYEEKTRVPSRNAAHALTQTGRGYGIGLTPPLVAVSERMFKPRQVNIEAGDPRISLS